MTKRVCGRKIKYRVVFVMVCEHRVCEYTLTCSFLLLHYARHLGQNRCDRDGQRVCVWGGGGEMLVDISLTKQTSLRRLWENPCPRPVSSLLDTVTRTAVIHRGWPGVSGVAGGRSMRPLCS
jgi:hypothetical protein